MPSSEMSSTVQFLARDKSKPVDIKPFPNILLNFAIDDTIMHPL